MATRVTSTEEFVDLHFPKAGMNVVTAFGKQPALPIQQGVYARTTPSGINVRTFEPGTDRARGAQRAGLSRYLPVPLIAGWIVQELNKIVMVGFPPPGGHMQLSNSGRVVLVVAVSQGQVYSANAGDQVWTAANNMTGLNPPLNFSGVVFSAPNQQKLWFADGVNWCYFTPATNQVNNWVAHAGILPVDVDGNTPTLICTWRGRTVLSGLRKDGQNWFMTAVDDPFNFDYSPLSQSPTQAVAGNNSPAGLIGDICTGLIPYTDDILVFLGDHTIYMMRGDPMEGGRIDLISDAIGGAWGQAWCKDPYGTVYFVSNKMGVYSFVPGQTLPQRISQPIEPLVQPIDTGNNTIRLIWDDRFQGLHIFITPTSAPAQATHYFFEQRTQSWWQDQFANHNHDPLCCCTFDGNTPGDRVALIGSWDGYVRYLNPTAVDDDGTPIASSVVIGPFVTPDLDELMLHDLQGVLGETSGSVTYSVFTGTTPEIALQGTPLINEKWGPGRNLSNVIRLAAHGIYVKITATNPWAMESIRARIASLGAVRRRGR